MLKNWTCILLLISCGISCYGDDAKKKKEPSNTVENRVPMIGGLGGVQIPFFNEKYIFEFTANIAIPSVHTEKPKEYPDKKESNTYYFAHIAEGVLKKYWPLQYKDWHVCVGFGGFISRHREYYEKHHKDIEEPTWSRRRELGFGSIGGAGVSCRLFSRFFLDGFVGGRVPLPCFFENYVKHPSFAVKLTVSYRFA